MCLDYEYFPIDRARASESIIVEVAKESEHQQHLPCLVLSFICLLCMLVVLIGWAGLLPPGA